MTHDKKHLDLAKHYLDIRGLPTSVNRSRHNQSYKPVLEQSEAVGHAVNCASLMVSLADVGVLTGIKDYFDAAQRMWHDVVDRKMYITGGVGVVNLDSVVHTWTIRSTITGATLTMTVQPYSVSQGGAPAGSSEAGAQNNLDRIYPLC